MAVEDIPYDVRKIIRAHRCPPKDLVLISAHRGLRLGHGTENSRAALAAAAAAKLPIAELDVRLTSDNIPVLLHDEGLGRATSYVEQYTSERSYNPLSGEGANPLVAGVPWHGRMEHVHLKDTHGLRTRENIETLQSLLEFIRAKRINMVLHLDVKDRAALVPSYEIIKRHTNAQGIPAMEWCVWKLPTSWFASRREFEKELWVQRAFSAGQPPLLIPVFEPEHHLDYDRLSCITSFNEASYVLGWEVGARGSGGSLQPLLDFVRSHRNKHSSIGLFKTDGDLPDSFQEGEELAWSDARAEYAIRNSADLRAWTYYEGRPVCTYDSLLHPLDSPMEKTDCRASMDWILQQGYNWVIADHGIELSDWLAVRGLLNLEHLHSTAVVSG